MKDKQFKKECITENRILLTIIGVIFQILGGILFGVIAPNVHSIGKTEGMPPVLIGYGVFIMIIGVLMMIIGVGLVMTKKITWE